jgi:nucleotide-binding universal stress UspA family protein
MKRILLAIDSSDHSQRAIGVAEDIAKMGGVELIVFHAHEEGIASPMESRKEAENLVNGVVSELTKDGVNARGQAKGTHSGRAPQEIIEAAKSDSVDLIVLGSRGLSDFAGLLVGSVAHKVIHHAECPVLVVK